MLLRKEMPRSFTSTFSSINNTMKVIALGITSVTFAAAPPFADDLAAQTFDGAQARITEAANLIYLTEAVAAKGCFAMTDTTLTAAQTELDAHRTEFSAVLAALEFGSEVHGIPYAERRALTIQELHAVAAFWAPLDTAAKSIADGNGAEADFAVIRDARSTLNGQVNDLAVTFEEKYTTSQEVLLSEATVLKYAVRQRMLAYAMSRSLCDIIRGDTDTAAAREELAANADLFHNTLLALRDGFPAAGINAPPNSAVTERLVATYDIWMEKRAIFEAVAQGDTPGLQDLAPAAAFSRALSDGMEDTVILYKEAFHREAL